ncbi:LysR family transcriptional regulator [Novosphingobium sp. SG720]|uniref:LysR family transcriptional regulator n=1 Tax=Novosphingobium sp. SG720 TaxID=2586998 RepID=UPI001445DA3C|nr:LysR family transcriptional regulator [Novosphingobium sp. SG720]NKJ42276.1 DNA-binding transcriptional LysR family regulator [Novosphingobium sp. SG720]
MKTHLTLRQLEIFLAVARLGSFRAAGAMLNLAPVVVGEHVRALEARLGGPLFLRRPGMVPTLTPLGEQIVIRAEDVLLAIARLEDDARSHVQAGESVWHVCIAPYALRHLAHRVGELRRRFPECQIVLHSTDLTASQTMADVRSGTLDLAIVIADQLAEPDEGLGFAELGVGQAVTAAGVIDEPLAMFVAHDHPLAGRPAITREDLMAWPLAGLSPPHPLRQVVNAALHRAGLQAMRYDVETDDYNAILASVVGDGAVACLFAEARALDAITHRLEMLDLAFNLPSPQALLVLTSRARADRRLQIAADFLANHYRADATAARRALAVV